MVNFPARELKNTLALQELENSQEKRRYGDAAAEIGGMEVRAGQQDTGHCYLVQAQKLMLPT